MQKLQINKTLHFQCLYYLGNPPGRANVAIYLQFDENFAKVDGSLRQANAT